MSPATVAEKMSGRVERFVTVRLIAMRFPERVGVLIGEGEESGSASS